MSFVTYWFTENQVQQQVILHVCRHLKCQQAISPSRAQKPDAAEERRIVWVCFLRLRLLQLLLRNPPRSAATVSRTGSIFLSRLILTLIQHRRRRRRISPYIFSKFRVENSRLRPSQELALPLRRSEHAASAQHLPLGPHAAARRSLQS